MKGDPFVRLEFKNGVVDEMDTSKMKADDIFRRMKHAVDEIDAKDTMKKAGLENIQLQSQWGATDYNPGKAQRTPTM